MIDRAHRWWMALYAVWSCTLVGELVLLFLRPAGAIGWLRWLGWALFAISAILGWVPIFAFHRRGGVGKGKSYVHTTELVTSGLYALVRHPQYLAGDFIVAATICITQWWPTAAIGAVAIATNRLSMVKADRDLVAKFGAPYRRYMRSVPRASLVVGFWRRLHAGRCGSAAEE